MAKDLKLAEKIFGEHFETERDVVKCLDKHFSKDQQERSSKVSKVSYFEIDNLENAIELIKIFIKEGYSAIINRSDCSCVYCLRIGNNDTFFEY